MEVHHDKETFSEILKKVADEYGWSEYYSINLESSSEELMNLKREIAEAVTDYHINNKVSGKVLCKRCHKDEHASYNFKDKSEIVPEDSIEMF